MSGKKKKAETPKEKKYPHLEASNELALKNLGISEKDAKGKSHIELNNQ